MRQCHPVFVLFKWQGDMAKEVAEKRKIFLNVINAVVPTFILQRLPQLTLEIFKPDLRPGSIETSAHMRALISKTSVEIHIGAAKNTDKFTL